MFVLVLFNLNQLNDLNHSILGEFQREECTFGWFPARIIDMLGNLEYDPWHCEGFSEFKGLFPKLATFGLIFFYSGFEHAENPRTTVVLCQV